MVYDRNMQTAYMSVGGHYLALDQEIASFSDRYTNYCTIVFCFFLRLALFIYWQAYDKSYLNN